LAEESARQAAEQEAAEREESLRKETTAGRKAEAKKPAGKSDETAKTQPATAQFAPNSQPHQARNLDSARRAKPRAETDRNDKATTAAQSWKIDDSSQGATQQRVEKTRPDPPDEPEFFGVPDA
jgi:hypothetical protein